MTEKQMRVCRKGRPALFILILFLMILVLSGCFGKLAVTLDNTQALGRDSVRVQLQQQRENSIDVLVLGDSESYTSFSPVQFFQTTGSTAFVAGQSGQKTTEAVSLLLAALDRQRPRAVILETNELFRYNNSWEAMRDKIYQGAGRLFPLFRYHNLWKACVEKKPKLVEESYFGFKIRKRVSAYRGAKDYMQATKKKAVIPASIRQDLEQIRKECQNRGIPLILYSAPSPVNYSMARHNAIAELAEKENITYLDLNLQTSEIGIDWNRDTLDGGDHLNYDGAVKTTDWLTKYLQKHITLENHKDDPAYADWKKVTEEYVSMVSR